MIRVWKDLDIFSKPPFSRRVPPPVLEEIVSEARPRESCSEMVSRKQQVVIVIDVQ